MRMRQLGVAQAALVLCSLLLVPAVVSAQDAGIAGVVTDDTGGCLLYTSPSPRAQRG